MKETAMILTAICLSLSLSGCGIQQTVTAAPAPDDSGSIASAMDAAAVQESQTEPPDEYPSKEEILSRVRARENKLYWCTEMPAYSGPIALPAVTTPDLETAAARLSELLDGTYQVAKSDESSGTIDAEPAGAGADPDVLLSALSRITGMEYIGISPEEIYTAQYVPAVNGYLVDDEGFSYAADRSGEIVLGSYVGVYEDGTISILNPLILEESPAKTVDSAELITPARAKTLCREYYESEDLGIPFVAMIRDISLEYYYSESEGRLLPAWRCEMTFYVTENGHDDSIMIDAQTGELLRK